MGDKQNQYCLVPSLHPPLERGTKEGTPCTSRGHCEAGDLGRAHLGRTIGPAPRALNPPEPQARRRCGNQSDCLPAPIQALLTPQAANEPTAVSTLRKEFKSSDELRAVSRFLHKTTLESRGALPCLLPTWPSGGAREAPRAPRTKWDKSWFPPNPLFPPHHLPPGGKATDPSPEAQASEHLKSPARGWTHYGRL